MSQAAFSAESAQRPKSYACPGCGAALYSPYHTLCPVCAEPIDPERIEQALGKRVDVAPSREGRHETAKLWIGLGALLGVGLVAALAAVLLR